MRRRSGCGHCSRTCSLCLRSPRGGDDAVARPVCETPAALPPARVAALRERVAAESGLAAVRGRAESELTGLGGDVAALRAGVERSVPAAAWLAGDELRVHADLVQ